MLNIITIDVPYITNIKLGLDTTSNQLYYNTSGDLDSNHTEIKSIQHIFLVDELPQTCIENSMYVLSGNLQSFITDDNGIPSGISYQMDDVIDSSSALSSVPASKAVYDFVTGAIETANINGVLKNNQENLITSGFNIKYDIETSNNNLCPDCGSKDISNLGGCEFQCNTCSYTWHYGPECPECGSHNTNDDGPGCYCYDCGHNWGYQDEEVNYDDCPACGEHTYNIDENYCENCEYRYQDEEVEYNNCPACGEYTYNMDENYCERCGYSENNEVQIPGQCPACNEPWDGNHCNNCDFEYTECPECHQYTFDWTGDSCIACGYTPNRSIRSLNSKKSSLTKNRSIEEETISPTIITKDGLYFNQNVNDNDTYITTYTKDGIIINDISQKESMPIGNAYNTITINSEYIELQNNDDGQHNMTLSLSGINVNVNGYDSSNNLEQFNLTASNIAFNNNNINTRNSLAALDQNGFILNDQLLHVNIQELDPYNPLPTEYILNGGVYTAFITHDDNTGEYTDPPFTQLKLSSPTNNSHYANENKYGYLRILCGVDNMQIEFPFRAKILTAIPTFKQGKLYLIKYLRNTFEVYVMSTLEMADNYVVNDGITIKCEEGEAFYNVRVESGGHLKLAATSASLTDVNVESGGILEYDFTGISSYEPVDYSLLKGSNTNIASGAIMMYDTTASGYCSNGTFYELDGLYRIGIGSNMKMIEPKVSYGTYSQYNSSTSRYENINYGARVYGYNNAIVSGASVGYMGNAVIYSNAVATNTILGGYTNLVSSTVDIVAPEVGSTYHSGTYILPSEEFSYGTLYELTADYTCNGSNLPTSSNSIAYTIHESDYTCANGDYFYTNDWTSVAVIKEQRNQTELTVSSGGSAINTIVSNNGILNATQSGYVNSATISSGGSCILNTNNNITNNNITIMPYGYYRQESSIVNNLTINAGSGNEGADVIISSGGTVNNLTLYKNGINGFNIVDNNMCRINGGYVSSVSDIGGIPTITLNSSGYINNLLSDITYSGNKFQAKLNIIVSNAIVNNVNNMILNVDEHVFDPIDPVQGYMNAVIESGGIISNYKNWVGSTIVSNGGLIQNASCYYAQSIFVSSGGSINNIYLHNPYYTSGSLGNAGGSPTLRVNSGGYINNINIGYGGIYVSGGVGTINQSQGFVIVYSNGSIFSAATTGRDFQVKGGFVFSLTVNGGSGALVNSSGYVRVCYVNNSNAIFKVSSAGTVEYLYMSRGKVSAFNGACISKLIVSSGTGGSASYTLSGTSINSMTLNNGGGNTYNTIIDYLNASGGFIIANSNTVISSADINCRDFILKTGAAVSSATYTNSRHGSGAIKISSGGVLNNLIFNNTDPGCIPNGTLTIYNGGIVSNCEFNNFIVSSGGTIMNNRVTYPEFGIVPWFWGSGIIKSGGTGINIHCDQYYNEYGNEGAAYEIEVQVGGYVSGYDVTGFRDITISSGTTIFSMNIISGELGGGGDLAGKIFTINAGGYVNRISAITDNNYAVHYLIIKSGGTALNVVRSSFNITSETGATVSYI